MTGPTIGPKQPAAATSHAPNTRYRASQSQEGDPQPSGEDLAKVNRAHLPTPKQAKEYLERNSYLPKGVPVTLPLLSYALLLLVQAATPKVCNEGVRAVARILESEALEKMLDPLISYVNDKLSPMLEHAEQVMESMTNSTDEVRRSADRLYRTGEDTRDEILKSVETLNSTVDHWDPPSIPNPTAGAILSYAAAASLQLPLSHDNTMARSHAREKQILIDRDPSVDTNGLSDLSERELVAKANEAIIMIRNQENREGDGDGANVVGAKKLRNGGVIFELNTSQAAQWVRREKQMFERSFGGSSIIKDRSVSVLVENVPTGFAPEAMAESRKIERDSGLESDSLISTRWIKPLHRRTPGQRTAHIIAKFRTPEAANIAIRDGMIIAGKRSWARRMKREPRRCLKCHALDSRHIAAECEKQDTCGTCGKDHRTAVCTETDHRCANCNTAGHASWDRFCPKFTDRCKRLESADPESSYKYFPSEASWTWEQRSAVREGPNPSSQGDLRSGHDSTLNQVRQSSWYEETERIRPWSRNSRHDRESHLGDPQGTQGPRSSGHRQGQMTQTTLDGRPQRQGTDADRIRHEYIA